MKTDKIERAVYMVTVYISDGHTQAINFEVFKI